MTIHNKTWAFSYQTFFFLPFLWMKNVSKRNEGKHSEMGRDFHFSPSIIKEKWQRKFQHTEKWWFFLSDIDWWKFDLRENTTRLPQVCLLVQLSRMSLEGEKFFIIKVWQMTFVGWVTERLREGGEAPRLNLQHSMIQHDVNSLWDRSFCLCGWLETSLLSY